MKPISLIGTLFCAALLLLYLGCGFDKNRSQSKEGSSSYSADLRVETAQGDFNLLTKNGEDVELAPKVPLDREEKLIQVINTNLDLDLNEEQILVLRKKDDPDAPLRIAVVDYDTVRGSYSRTWEGLTNATNLRLFEVSLKDLVGDHNLEIVCRGMNSSGELTLNVFRKTPPPTGLGLYFTEISRIVSDGSIEIQEIERSEGYRLGQKNGPSFIIYSYTQDRESSNLLDRIKYTYNWQYQQNRYILSSVEKLPGAVVEEKQLRELFANPSAGAFEEYLSGPWYLSGSEGKEEIILFSPEEKQITIYSGQVEEIYIWQASFRSLSNRLLIFTANESIESIQKRIYIEVVSLNTIDVSIIGAEQWDRTAGRYIKLSEELQQELLKKKQSEVKPSAVSLKGVYKSGKGIEIIFDPPHFTWIGERRQFSGGFTIILLDKEVLYLKGLDENGLPVEDATYIMEYSEKKEGGYFYRTLTLTPGRMSVHGVKPVSEEKITFEQLESLEKGD